MHSAGGLMSARVETTDDTRMANFLYQNHHGHIVVNVEGNPYLLDTGAPFSVGYEPITICGREFPVEQCYMGVTGSYLSEQVGVLIEGMIGADILQYFNLGIYETERMLQFSRRSAAGDVVIPVQDYLGIPVLCVKIGDRVRRMFFDTGAPLSYLLPEDLQGTEPDGRYEDFYPLLGNFQTEVYTRDVHLGGLFCVLKFGELPEELHPLLQAGNVQGVIGTELLKHFAINLSIRDKVLGLEQPFSMLESSTG